MSGITPKRTEQHDKQNDPKRHDGQADREQRDATEQQGSAGEEREQCDAPAGAPRHDLHAERNAERARTEQYEVESLWLEHRRAGCAECEECGERQDRDDRCRDRYRDDPHRAATHE
jgi:hypothetical protein